nr:Phage-related protein (COG4718) [uncultured Mediterranean phage uvMED]BAR26433.1 Phage-related protein (COG4718) [uncultured Mediterranean phage uvMED]
MASWDSSVNISPDFSSTKQSSIVVREVQFGDGYKKLVNYGLNNDLKKYNFKFENKTTTEKNTIVNFLEAREGTDPFDYTAPDQSSSSKYICKNWTETFTAAGLFTITVVFEEVAIP